MFVSPCQTKKNVCHSQWITVPSFLSVVFPHSPDSREIKTGAVMLRETEAFLERKKKTKGAARYSCLTAISLQPAVLSANKKKNSSL